MTLREYVSNFMEVNNITTSVDEMLAKIKEVARDRASKGVAVMDEEDVEAVILGKVEPKAKPVVKVKTVKTKKEPEKKDPEEVRTEVKKEIRERYRPKVKGVDEGQLSIFDL